MGKRTYHGWIIMERSEGYRDRYHAEWVEQVSEHTQERRRELDTGSAAEVFEWWERRLGRPVGMEPTGFVVGAAATPTAYRVYTVDEPHDGRVRVLRLLEYTYDSTEAMIADMKRWGVPAHGSAMKDGGLVVNAVLPPEILEGE